MEWFFNYLVTIGIDSFAASWVCAILAGLLVYTPVRMILYAFKR